MSYNDILNELRAKMTSDDHKVNAEILRSEGRVFAKEGNADGLRAVGELILEIMPEEEKEEIRRLTHLEGKRLDEYYKDILRLINEKDYIKAKTLCEKLYGKITEEYAETETNIFVSLRNPFEDALYHELHKPEKTVSRTPFDFAAYISTYAYVLIESGSTLEAIPVLRKAEEFNPVDCGPKFELAEVYKLLKNKKKLIEVTQETLKVASSPAAIARCYANMGYICVETRDLEDAVAFYTASVMFAPHPAIPHELRGISQMMNKPITKPTHEEIKAVMKKYDIEFGPDRDLISVAAQLSSHFLMTKDIPNALNALKLLYNITLDEKIKETILKYEPDARMAAPDGSPYSENEKPNITRTVNENPEQ